MIHFVELVLGLFAPTESERRRMFVDKKKSTCSPPMFLFSQLFSGYRLGLLGSSSSVQYSLFLVTFCHLVCKPATARVNSLPYPALQQQGSVTKACYPYANIAFNISPHISRYLYASACSCSTMLCKIPTNRSLKSAPIYETLAQTKTTVRLPYQQKHF